MNFHDALSEIRAFWTEPRFPFVGGGISRLAVLEAEYGHVFPPDVRSYISSVLSPNRFVFESIGNPIDVYGFEDLARQVDGYNRNPVTKAPLDGWDDDWLLIADEGADPIVVNVRRDAGPGPVLQSMHGEGEWEFHPIASCLAQFLLLAAARHHALLMLDFAHRITDDEHGFNLGAKSAEWLFPRVKRWAPEYYSAWVGAFDNA